MHEEGWLGERRSYGERLKKISQAVHDLCQPLTTLQCRLELAGMVGTPDAYREAVRLGLVECARLVDAVELMREIVRASMQQADAQETPAQEVQADRFLDSLRER